MVEVGGLSEGRMIDLGWSPTMWAGRGEER